MGFKIVYFRTLIIILLGGDVGIMNNINDKHFRIRRVIKNKCFLKLSMISLLLIFLLCSCNKDDSNLYDEIDALSQSDNISEEALSKVRDEVKVLTGLDDVDGFRAFKY